VISGASKPRLLTNQDLTPMTQVFDRVLSRLPEARSFPSGENATENTDP
jgi:hypothetical protein